MLYITHKSVKKTWRNVKTEWDAPQTSQDKEELVIKGVM